MKILILSFHTCAVLLSSFLQSTAVDAQTLHWEFFFSPSHRYYPQFSPNSSVERTIWWSAAQMHVSCLLHLFSVIQPLPDTAAGTDTFFRFLFLRRKKSQFIFKMEMTIGREGNHLALWALLLNSLPFRRWFWCLQSFIGEPTVYLPVRCVLL